jgi:hypothetical protein
MCGDGNKWVGHGSLPSAVAIKMHRCIGADSARSRGCYQRERSFEDAMLSSIRAIVFAGILAFDVSVVLLMPANAQPPAVLTQHNDRARTGVNDAESSLTRAAVGQGSIGKLAWLGVRGQIYAQPLYLPTVRIGTVTHKVVFVATMRNNVYAFDADQPMPRATSSSCRETAPQSRRQIRRI